MKLKKPKFWDDSEISILAILFFPISLIFLLFSFINKLKIPKKFPIPIICVGNIYVGGTGKTPLVSKIFNIIKSLGKNPGFIKKYYNYLDDEISILQKIGTTFVYENRVEAVKNLVTLNN